MGYVLKVFGQNGMWNLRPSDNPNPVTPAEITIISKGPEIIESVVNTEEGSFRVIVTGNFEYQEPAPSAAQASGKVSTFTVYKNGLLHEYEAYGSPVDLALTINTSFSEGMSWLSGDDLFVGSPTGDESDEIQGLGGNDTFFGYASGQWGDKFYGGDGIDTAVLRGSHSEYNIKFIDYMWDGRIVGGGRVEGHEITDNAAGRDGIDYLNNVERLKFSDTMVGLDVGKGENTGEVYRLYLSVLGRNPQADAEGCGFWIDKLDRTVYSIDQIVGNFLNSQEFVARFGASTSSNDSFVNLLYQNMLGRDGHSDPGFNFWLGVLNNQQGSRSEVVVGFMESPENVAAAAPLIGDTPTYHQWVE